MNMFDKISGAELDMITTYIETCASYDNDDDCVSLKQPLKHILRFWERDKEDLFRVFGKELVLSKKVSFTKPAEILENEIGEMMDCDHDGYTFYKNFNAWRREQNYCDKYDLSTLMWASTLSANIYTGSTMTIDKGDGHKIVINNGCKASKILGKLAAEFNIEGYEKFRIAHSQCLNQKQLFGELCISIHPLDYMTMSDNNCGWSSCMSWQDRGDYRQGTVEMMNSPCVVVAYLKSHENMYIGTHKWNNKKWRQLFIVTPHIITGIREYPYVSPELNGIVLQWLRELAQTNGAWGPYEDTTAQVKNNTLFPVASLGREIRLDFHTRFMYNDFYSTHLAYLSPSIPSDYSLCFSGVSECMECGADMSEECDQCTALLVCDDCEQVYWCEECGERVSLNDTVFVDGNRVCSYCYENYYATCDLCEETHHTGNIFNVYIRVDDTTTDYYLRVCGDCLASDKFHDSFGKSYNVACGPWDTRMVVDLKNFKDVEALDQFDVWHSDDYERFKEYLEKAKAIDEN